MLGLSRITVIWSKVYLVALLLSLHTPPAIAGHQSQPGHPHGFTIWSVPERHMALRLGGVLDIDYRHYLESERADNRFDIRRARLVLDGQLAQWLRFYTQYEFQGNEPSNLVDAYVDAFYGRQALRFGQFKEPFGLEWQTRDKAILTAERSMTQYLSPARGLGAMLHGTLGQELLHYGIGVFNADGDDGATRGTQEDSPEIAARLVVAPFKGTNYSWIRNFQVGGSFSQADIELANLNFRVKSAGMVGTAYNIYTLGQNTKFGVLQDVQSRRRLGVEAAWCYGPLLLQGEYVTLRFTGLKPAGQPAADADFSAWHAGVAYAVTGEPWVLRHGIPQPVQPLHVFQPGASGWGALVVTARLERFEGDEAWITPSAFVSVRQADAYTISLNWVPLPMVRVIGDFTYTDLSDPVRTRVNPDGSVDYITEETVFTVRFSIDF
jgi:phosphate-selective porin OprO and OprP